MLAIPRQSSQSRVSTPCTKRKSILLISIQSVQSRVSNRCIKCCSVLAIPREYAQSRWKPLLEPSCSSGREMFVCYLCKL